MEHPRVRGERYVAGNHQLHHYNPGDGDPLTTHNCGSVITEWTDEA